MTSFYHAQRVEGKLDLPPDFTPCRGGVEKGGDACVALGGGMLALSLLSYTQYK